MEEVKIRKNFTSWEEAFGALAKELRQQSVRVASYSRMLFLATSESPFNNLSKYEESNKAKYSDDAYQCGFYHQIGKAIVPKEYQVWKKDFSEEEKIVYRKYPGAGVAIVENFFARTEKKKVVFGKKDKPESNMSKQLLIWACRSHCERYDGTGYPDGLRGDDIPPIAQIVAIAKDFDRYATERISEDPFSEAFEKIVSGSGTAYSPALVTLFENKKNELRAIYRKYINYAKELPKSIPLLIKRKGRPMGLTYKGMVGEENAAPVYEAIPYFCGIYGAPDVKEHIQDVGDQIERIGFTQEMCLYLLYEACDAIYRLRNCKIEINHILLPLLPAFYHGESKMEAVEKVLSDEGIERKKLVLILPQSTLLTLSEKEIANVNALKEIGLEILLDDWDPALFPLEKVREIGWNRVRPEPYLLRDKGARALFSSLPGIGMTVYAKGVDDRELKNELFEIGFSYLTGAITSIDTDEETLIRDLLAKVNDHE